LHVGFVAVYRRRWSISASLQEGDASRHCCVTKKIALLNNTSFDCCDIDGFHPPEAFPLSSQRKRVSNGFSGKRRWTPACDGLTTVWVIARKCSCV
jgi:hypothetical protein